MLARVAKAIRRPKGGYFKRIVISRSMKKHGDLDRAIETYHSASKKGRSVAKYGAGGALAGGGLAGAFTVGKQHQKNKHGRRYTYTRKLKK